MKTVSRFKTPKKLLFTAITTGFAACALFISSCSKDSSSVGVSAYVKAVNSAQASAPQDFYVDNAKANSSAMAYTQNSGYITIGSGTHTAQFKTSTTATVNTSFSLSVRQAVTILFFIPMITLLQLTRTTVPNHKAVMPV